jgi:ppGpp synthetase/RelA/SpoT-type nucleotidyltranferase
MEDDPRSGTPTTVAHMALPMSRTQIQKLGERLAAGADEDHDREALEELVACHLAVIETGRPRLDGLADAVGTAPLHISHRPKTTTTIIEKLQRESGMSLPRMQDLAGIRIVGPISLDEQDRLADEIMRRFPADPRGTQAN